MAMALSPMAHSGGKAAAVKEALSRGSSYGEKQKPSIRIIYARAPGSFSRVRARPPTSNPNAIICTKHDDCDSRMDGRKDGERDNGGSKRTHRRGRRRWTDGDDGWVVVRSLALPRGSGRVDSDRDRSGGDRTVLSAASPAAEGAERCGRALLLGGRLSRRRGVSIEQTKSATDDDGADGGGGRAATDIVDSWSSWILP